MSNDVIHAEASPLAYESLGIPTSVVSARAMVPALLRTAIINTVAYLEETDVARVNGWPTATDGSVAVDSQLGVDVFNEFTAHLVVAGKFPLDLAKISQAKWASIDGLVAVLTETFAAMKVKARMVES
jgi:hypothetical protein